MKKAFLMVLLTVSTAASPLWADPGIAVIVHPANPVASLSTADVMRLYLGKTRVFPDQSPARLVSLSDGVSPRREFDARVLNKSPNQVRAYWAQQIFTGRGTPPQELSSADAVRAYVASHVDAVGFIGATGVDASVKTVLQID
jgi:hypothetical protein